MLKKHQSYIDWFIEKSLEEDIGSGDHTSNACIDPDNISIASLLVKDNGVIAGVDFAKKVFEFSGEKYEFEVLKKDGTLVRYGDIVFNVKSSSRNILKLERVILNTMQRLSGIATLSSEFAVEVKDFNVKILDTRKTTPLMRPLEKWAVTLGGCFNYRDGLYDWIMIKDNHIEAGGGISNTILKVQDYLKQNKLNLKVTIEVKNLTELREVLAIGNVDRIMFDNFDIGTLKEAVVIVDKKYETEASGGVTLDSVRTIAETGVDFISCGALTHSAGILDLSLKIIHQ